MTEAELNETEDKQYIIVRNNELVCFSGIDEEEWIEGPSPCSLKEAKRQLKTLTATYPHTNYKIYKLTEVV
jgi:hypothetical protein